MYFQGSVQVLALLCKRDRSLPRQTLPEWCRTRKVEGSTCGYTKSPSVLIGSPPWLALSGDGSLLVHRSMIYDTNSVVFRSFLAVSGGLQSQNIRHVSINDLD